MEAILFDSRAVEDMAEAAWNELDEIDRSEDMWRQLWKESQEDIRSEFEHLKETLVEGIPKGDVILLVRRDEAESELRRPEEAFGKCDHLCIYYEDGDIWINELDKYDADYRVLWVPAQNEDDLPEDMKEDCWNLCSMASMGLDASDTAYMLDLCETKSIAPVFREELKWNGVNIFKEAQSEMHYLQRASDSRRR